MALDDLHIDIDPCGYKGKITRVFPRAALPPWYPEDELLFIVEFAKPNPEGILEIAIAIPVSRIERKDRENILKIIQEEGNKQLAASIGRAITDRVESDKRRQKEKDLESFAGETAKVLRE